MSFASEAEMSRHFRESFASLVRMSGLGWVDELEGLFGIPDYVLFKNSSRRVLYVVSFELKLRDWRRGLKQAFRYRNFSNEVFLVLDSSHVENALRHLELFSRSNVGLASYGEEGVFEVHSLPQPSVPFSDDFSERAVSRLLKRCKELSTSERIPALSPAFARTIRGRFPVNSVSSVE